MRTKMTFLLHSFMMQRLNALSLGNKAYRGQSLSCALASYIACSTRLASSASQSSALSFSGTLPSAVTQQMENESKAETNKLVHFYQNEFSQISSKDNAKPPTIWTNRQESCSFVRNNIDTVLFDCDGVIYRSPDPAPGASQCIQNLLSQGKQIFFVTNNAASSRLQLKEKLEEILQLPKETLTPEMMVGSGFSAAQYLKQVFLDTNQGNRRLYVIGSPGLVHELEQTGFEVVLDNNCEKPSMTREELAEFDFPEEPIDAVVVGHDVELNFRKLCIANVLLQRNPQAPLIATNLDSFDLVGADGRHIPGNGGAVRYLEHTSKRQAINCGKPSPLLADLLDSLYGLDTSRALFVGDRLDTDIRFGKSTGMKSVLVMTGVTTVNQLKSLKEGTDEEPLPDFITPHMGYLA